MPTNIVKFIRVPVARYPNSVVIGRCAVRLYESAGNKLPMSVGKYEPCVVFDVETLHGRVIVSDLRELPDKQTAEIAVQAFLNKSRIGRGRRPTAKPVKTQRSVSMFDSDYEFLLSAFESASQGIEVLVKFYQMHHAPGGGLFDVKLPPDPEVSEAGDIFDGI